MAAIPQPAFATLAGASFPTQTALLARLKEMLHAHKEGEYVGIADAHLLLQALRNHPEADMKIGAGVWAFQKRINPPSPGRKSAPGFWIIRVDGTEDHFSIYEVTGPKRNKKEIFLQKIEEAMREAIADRLRAEKDSAFGLSETIICPVSEREIYREKAHTDHAGDFPFARIKDEFLLEFGRYLRPHHIDESGLGCRFADEHLRECFVDFHDERACLQVICKWANMSKGSGGYISQFKTEMLEMEAPCSH